METVLERPVVISTSARTELVNIEESLQPKKNDAVEFTQAGAATNLQLYQPPLSDGRPGNCAGQRGDHITARAFVIELRNSRSRCPSIRYHHGFLRAERGGTNTLVFRNSADAGWLAGENDHHFWRNWQRKGSASFIHIEGAFEMVAANGELGPSDRLIVPLADMPPRGGNCSARWELPLLLAHRDTARRLNDDLKQRVQK